MNFSHFIITQFNIRNFPLSDNTDYQSWQRWTRERIDLFREYCLPSILNQTCREFTWLLYFDPGTAAEFSDFLDELSKYPFIGICYSKGLEDFNSNYMEEVKKRVGNSTRWVITTRVDNDDCLHKDAVRTIRENFTEKHKFLISLASGYVLNISDGTLSHYFYPMSPFISLIEDTEIETLGVFEKIHTRWESLRLFVLKEIWLQWFNRKARRSRFILKKPFWIQTFHGGNVSNSFLRGFPVLRERNLSDFSLAITSKGLPLKIIVKYYNYVMWKRYFKALIIKCILRK